MTTTNKNTKIELTVTKWHVLLSVFLVTLNAFAPNPPFTWTFGGWFWMTAPFMFPIYLFLVAYALYLVTNLIITLLK